MDQIADLLIRIKNASLVGKRDVVITFSKMNKAILDILKESNFLTSVEVVKEENRQFLKVVISDSKTPTHFKQISKPGRRVYAKNQEIPKPLRGLGTVIISTSTGITTGKEAFKKGLGGELICEVW
jgi:small subunit ribosomal protein S8